MQVKILIQKLLKNRERNYLLFSQILGAFIGIVYGKLVAVYIPISDFGVFNLYYGIYFFFFSVFGCEEFNLNPFTEISVVVRIFF